MPRRGAAQAFYRMPCVNSMPAISIITCGGRCFEVRTLVIIQLTNTRSKRPTNVHFSESRERMHRCTTGGFGHGPTSQALTQADHDHRVYTLLFEPFKGGHDFVASTAALGRCRTSSAPIGFSSPKSAPVRAFSLAASGHEGDVTPQRLSRFKQNQPARCSADRLRSILNW